LLWLRSGEWPLRLILLKQLHQIRCRSRLPLECLRLRHLQGRELRGDDWSLLLRRRLPTGKAKAATECAAGCHQLVREG